MVGRIYDGTASKKLIFDELHLLHSRGKGFHDTISKHHVDLASAKGFVRTIVEPGAVETL